MNTLNKIFGWLLQAAALACFVIAVATIAATFGKPVALIVTMSGVGIACMNWGNKLIG